MTRMSTTEPMSPGDAYEHLKQVYPVWLAAHRLLYPDRYPDETPQQVTIGAVVSSLKALHASMPDQIAESWEDLEAAIDDDLEFAIKCLDKLVRDWWYTRDICYGSILQRVVNEYGSRNNRDSLVLEELIDQLDKPVASAAELAEKAGMAAGRVGRVLRTLGHLRRRVRYSGSSQFVWIVKDHEQYKSLPPSSLLAVWEGRVAEVADTGVSFM